VLSQPTQPSATGLNEPLSSHLTTNVPVTQPHVDYSYNTYNHNGLQRRRAQRHNRRHRNPIIQPTATNSTSYPTLTTEAPHTLPSTITTSPPTTLPIPALECSPALVNSTMADLNQQSAQPLNASRRSTRGPKVVQFDPRTHRILPVPVLRASSLTSPSSSADTFMTETSEIRLRQALKEPDAAIWEKAVAMELGRLAQGVPGLVDGTNTMRFIPHSAKLPDRISSYRRTVCSINMNKSETHRVRLTYGGDCSDYDSEVSTPTADITAVKLHFNFILSTPGEKHMTLDLKNFYLNTPMERFEYMRIPMSIIPPAIIKHYDPLPLITNGHVMVEIMKGIYGLPQAGILAKKLLDERLLTGGYTPATHTPGLYRHSIHPIQFTLWVDDFSVKYIHKRDADALISLWRQHYDLTTDWTGTNSTNVGSFDPWLYPTRP